MSTPPINPYNCPHFAQVSSTWRGEALWWKIGKLEISDQLLRMWCRENLDGPYCYVDVMRQFHINAFAQAHPEVHPMKPQAEAAPSIVACLEEALDDLWKLHGNGFGTAYEKPIAALQSAINQATEGSRFAQTA